MFASNGPNLQSPYSKTTNRRLGGDMASIQYLAYPGTFHVEPLPGLLIQPHSSLLLQTPLLSLCTCLVLLQFPPLLKMTKVTYFISSIISQNICLHISSTSKMLKNQNSHIIFAHFSYWFNISFSKKKRNIFSCGF